MKRSFLWFAACVFTMVVSVAAGAPPVSVDPPELVALREGYRAELAPFRSRVEEAIKARGAKYASDLQAVEEQAIKTNRLEAVPVIKAERETFASGGWTPGFPKDAKAVPSSAHELRRAFDRDCAKIRADIVPAARPIVTEYTRKLDELEKRLTASKSIEAALAVRQEKQSLQGAGSDPLSGTNSLVVGKWLDEKGKDFEFMPNGEVPGGKWSWVDRSRRALKINWNAGPKFYLDIVISPDGSEMSGVNASGGKRHFTRKRP